MTLKQWLNNGWLRSHTPRRQEIADLLAIVDRDLALAVKERRVLDLKEQAELDRAMERAWANLPIRYQWLREWEYV